MRMHIHLCFDFANFQWGELGKIKKQGLIQVVYSIHTCHIQVLCSSRRHILPQPVHPASSPFHSQPEEEITARKYVHY